MDGGAVTPSATPGAGEHDITRPALREVFDDHAAFVWRTLRHLGVREQDLADVCQDVFITVHRKLDGFEWRSSLRTWLYGICLRVASDHRRRAYVRREIPVSQLPPRAVEATQDSDCERGRARELLATLLDQLDDDKRAVFVLYEVEGMAMKDIAALLECPVQTAYSRLHAARRVVLDGARRVMGSDE